MAVFISNAAFSFAPPPDSTGNHYIEEYPEKFYIRPFLMIRDLKLDLESRSDNGKLDFHPNGNSYLGIGFYVFDIGIGMSLKLPESQRRNNKFGNTESLDLQSNIYAKKWGADLSLQQYKGFYIRNPVAHFPDWQDDSPFPHRADLTVNKVSLNAFYLANHKRFSYRSAFNQADRQRKSSGSFYFGTKILYQDISADTSLIPYNSRQDFNLDNFSWATFYSLGFLPGYTHTFVYKYFYVNISFALGPAYLMSFHNENNELSYHRQVTSIVNLRGALGYNSPRWIAGISFVNHRSTFMTKHLQISGQTENFRIFLGYRFNETGFLKKDLLQ